MEERKKLFVAFTVALMFALSSCGGSESGQNYFYSVDVVNTTGVSITVRYDWDVMWLTYEWQGEDTILPGDRTIIEWNSEKALGEQVEVEYLGIKKLYPVYPVPQVCTITVIAQDF
jgi:hypothetical protein